MYPLLGLYLLIPFISPWLRTATARQERFFIILWAITTCLPYINRFYGEVFGQCWWNQYHLLYDFSGYPGYLVLAHYIRVHLDWEKPKRLTIGLICLILGTVATILSFSLQAEPGVALSYTELEIGWCFCTINCVVATFGAFLLFTCIGKAGKGYGLIQDISKKSYGMFLMHLLWLWFWAPLITERLDVSLAIPAIALATYVCSYITTKLISYIPGSKWIVGC